MASKRIRNMEEFAEVSGISRPTLSKFFQDPTSVRQSTRKRIEGALAEYDYRPNVFALNQNRKLTRTIGIVVPYLGRPGFRRNRPDSGASLHLGRIPDRVVQFARPE